LKARSTNVPVSIAIALCACGRAEPTSVSPAVDAWARRILAMPVAEVYEGQIHADYFCSVAAQLVSPEVRALGAHMISLQNVHRERYIDLDWGGGHVDAYGVIIGPSGWSHVADPERRERKLRDGVFAYDMRQ
jgi:hypothetical protein